MIILFKVGLIAIAIAGISLCIYMFYMMSLSQRERAIVSITYEVPRFIGLMLVIMALSTLVASVCLFIYFVYWIVML